MSVMSVVPAGVAAESVDGLAGKLQKKARRIAELEQELAAERADRNALMVLLAQLGQSYPQIGTWAGDLTRQGVRAICVPVLGRRRHSRKNQEVAA